MYFRLPKAIKGTTITTFVGEEAIFIAADGKATDGAEGNKGEIFQGCWPKILKITDYIYVSTSGWLEHCAWMVNQVRKKVKKLSRKVRMFVVTKEFKKQMKRWNRKKGPANPFPGNLLVFGYYRGRGIIYDDVQDRYLESEGNGKRVYGNGSGSIYSISYMENLIEEHNGSLTTDHIVEGLLNATAVSSLHDRWSRSYVGVVAVWKDKRKMKKQGDNCLRHEHVLHIISRNYNLLQDYMENVLLFVSYGMPYNISNELKFEGSSFCSRDEGVESSHLIAKGKSNSENPFTIIIRVMVFKDANARVSFKNHPVGDVLSWSTSKYDFELCVAT